MRVESPGKSNVGLLHVALITLPVRKFVTADRLLTRGTQYPAYLTSIGVGIDFVASFQCKPSTDNWIRCNMITLIWKII